MGLSGKKHHQFNVELHETSEKWAIPGISLREMKPISIPSTAVANTEDVDVHQDEWPTTPTAASFRIPTGFPCPPPPKKQKASSKFGYRGAREFFSPPDLETVFILKATSP